MFLAPCHEETVLKVTQDQHQELADFYRRIEQRAFRMAMIETRQSSDALDIVQDAMESLMKSYMNKPSEEWRPLFYRILQNKIKDWHRWGAVRAKLHLSKSNLESSEDWLESQVASTQPTPDNQAQGELSMQHLQEALNQLSLRQRQTFLLRVWEGFSVNETADIMKCSCGSVKTHLSRALKSLKNSLEDPS